MADEKIVAQCYSILYLPSEDGASWVPLAQNWGQTCVLLKEGVHRLLWWNDEQQLRLDATLTAKCVYSAKTNHFHKFIDDENRNYGFGFYEPDVEVSSSFQKAVEAVLVEKKAQLEAAADKPSEPQPEQSTEQSQSKDKEIGEEEEEEDEPKTEAKRGKVLDAVKQLEKKFADDIDIAQVKGDAIYQNDMIPLGQLPILPAKALRNPDFAQTQPDIQRGISDPFEITHEQHVRYDPDTHQFVGLPTEWEKEMKKQFGLPPNKIARKQLPDYKSPIPLVLIQLRDYLFEHSGHLQEGVFRLAPDAVEFNVVKRQCNEGEFVKCNDIHCVSNCIKVWFRDLPRHVLDDVPEQRILECDSEDSIVNVIESISEPFQSLMYWLLDLCVDVSFHASVNRMSAQNLAIVFSPNLFTPQSADPMQSLLYSQKAANFLHKAILWRSKRRTMRHRTDSSL